MTTMPADGFKRWLQGWLDGGPHIVINKGYLLRWYLIPRNGYSNAYLHKFVGSDDPRALHDHSYWFVSIMLRGGYTEVLPGGRTRYRRPGSIAFCPAPHAHRVVLGRDGEGRPKPAWTIFITGPRRREWGFYCPQGWLHWEKFMVPGGYGETGPGCDGGDGGGPGSQDHQPPPHGA